MELKYFWVKDFRRLKNIGFNFSPSGAHKLEYDGKNLKLEYNPKNVLANFNNLFQSSNQYTYSM